MQVQNILRTKQCEKTIQTDFKTLLCETAVETLLDKGWRPQNCDDLKLVLEKLGMLKDIHEKAKGDSIGIIQGQLYWTRLSHLTSKTTAQKR